jgi:large conductance mechanosensitive channel
VLDFLIVAGAVFMMVKGINTMKKKEEEKPEEPPKPSEEVVLLQEIRDSLRK